MTVVATEAGLGWKGSAEKCGGGGGGSGGGEERRWWEGRGGGGGGGGGSLCKPLNRSCKGGKGWQVSGRAFVAL